MNELERGRRHGMSETLRRFIETAGEAIWILDEQRTTVFANARLSETLGRASETFTNVLAEDLVLDHDRERFVADVGEVLGGARRTADVALLHADGSEIWLTIRMTPIELAPDGPIGVLMMASDVTARLRTEGALRRSEARYRALVETAPDHILILTGDGRIEFISRGLGDASVESLIGTSFFNLIGASDRERARAAVMRALSKSAVVIEELDVCGLEQAVRRHVCRLRRIDDRFGPDRLVGFLTDVTEIKRVQQELHASQTRLLQAQRMEAVGRLAGGLAHDFNNILSVVSGCASFVAASLRSGDPIHDDVQRILEASARAESLTRQLLAFSRRQVLRPTAVDLGDVVRGLHRMLARLLGEHVLLRVDCGSDVPRVRVDVGQLEHVVVNLCTNARDWMGAGGTITIATARRALDEELAAREGVSAGSYAALSVSDTGPGLDDDALARVFEPFFRGDAPNDNGLLLASVYGIVRQSGGTVVASSEGRGTTFTVLLPADNAEPRSVRPTPRGEATILVVEDDQQVRYVIRRALEAAGYRTLTADGPDEAISIVERLEGRIDLLVTDVVMPGMSGTQLARCLAPLQPAMRVLYVTGYLDDTTLRLGLGETDAAIVHKPFAPLALVRRIAELLEGRNSLPP